MQRAFVVGDFGSGNFKHVACAASLLTYTYSAAHRHSQSRRNHPFIASSSRNFYRRIVGRKGGHMDVRMLSTCFSLPSTVALSTNTYLKIIELITGGALFKYVPCPKFGLDEPNFMLYQMICFTGEDFGSQQLSVSPLAGKFFDTTCTCAFLNPNAVAHLLPSPQAISRPTHQYLITLSTYPSRGSKL